MDGPNIGQSTAVVEIQDALIAVTAGVLDEGKDKVAAEAIATEIFNLDRANTDAVRGNRAGSAMMTWGDLRRLLAGTLRICLERLEQG